MRFAYLLASAGLVLSGACAPAAPPAPKVDLAAERTALLDADRAWNDAFNGSQSPVDAFLAAMADDARFQMADNPAVQGKDAIRGVLNGMASLPGFHIEWRATDAGVASSGDLGYTVGTYTMNMNDAAGKPMTIDGHYVTIWKKVDGAWKVAVDTGGPAAPPKPAE
jgi:ketosteroid isomerase-like protein